MICFSGILREFITGKASRDSVVLFANRKQIKSEGISSYAFLIINGLSRKHAITLRCFREQK